MKIISMRRGFQADHSSTSYEFLAVEKPLNPAERARVSRLSSRARPTSKRVSFVYNGDFSDLPGGWEPLMKRYYDVMYSESYGTWTLAMAFDLDRKTIPEIMKYKFSGTDDLGVTIEFKKERVVVSILCRMDYGSPWDDDFSSRSHDEEDEETEEDGLLNLLAENREHIKRGDYRLLYGIWQKYGYMDEEEEPDQEAPPEPVNMDKLTGVIETLLNYIIKE